MPDDRMFWSDVVTVDGEPIVVGCFDDFDAAWDAAHRRLAAAPASQGHEVRAEVILDLDPDHPASQALLHVLSYEVGHAVSGWPGRGPAVDDDAEVEGAGWRFTRLERPTGETLQRDMVRFWRQLGLRNCAAHIKAVVSQTLKRFDGQDGTATTTTTTTATATTAIFERYHGWLPPLIGCLTQAIGDREGEAGLLDLVSQLVDLSARQFDAEEAAMERIHYPGRRTHTADHSRFLEQLGLIIFALETATPIDPRIVDFFRQWTQSHLTSADQDLSDYLTTASVPSLNQAGAVRMAGCGR